MKEKLEKLPFKFKKDIKYIAFLTFSDYIQYYVAQDNEDRTHVDFKFIPDNIIKPKHMVTYEN